MIQLRHDSFNSGYAGTSRAVCGLIGFCLVN